MTQRVNDARRDLFIAAALTGMCGREDSSIDMRGTASRAIALADAVMSEIGLREKMFPHGDHSDAEEVAHRR